jgi:hypothetical protein
MTLGLESVMVGNMSPDYLTDLNLEQRRAVEHGIDSDSATKAPPLLVIASSG